MASLTIRDLDDRTEERLRVRAAYNKRSMEEEARSILRAALTEDSGAMVGPINLADPAFEPTDEQLQDLSKRAFAGVGAAHASSLEKLRAQIAVARHEALQALDERGGRKAP